jgi:hypothetical protein
MLQERPNLDSSFRGESTKNCNSQTEGHLGGDSNGIELSPDAQKRAILQDWLTFKVRPMFDPQRTLPVTEDVLLKWRLLMDDGRKTGHTFRNLIFSSPR